MRVLGVDPGTSTTGWGVVEAARPLARHVASGVIALPARLSLAERLRKIHRTVGNLIEVHRPEALGLERVFVSRNVQSAFRLGEARGAVLVAAAESGVPVFEYTPAEVKQAVVGYGRADKPQMQRAVAILLGIDGLGRADEADALAVAICHLQGAKLRRLVERFR